MIPAIRWATGISFSMPRPSPFPGSIFYDRGDKLWKMWFINQGPDYASMPANQGRGVPVYDGFGMMDIQAMHCTTAQMREIHPERVTPKRFTPQYMRAVGK